MAAITAAVAVGAGTAYSAHQQRGAARDAARAQAQGVEQAQAETRRASQEALPYIAGGYEQAYQDAGAGFSDAQQYLQGSRGYLDQSAQTLSPLAELASMYTGERDALLGLRGDGAYQSALGRVADPLAAEQEQAILRNSAALGGVGGNVLSELAEQTRRRTEANISNRINQLGAASSPGLNALQQIAQIYGQQANVSGQQASTAANAGTALANINAQRGGAMGNAILGQGSTLAQLAQNYGTAQAGGHAFQAQQANPWVQALNTGLQTYAGMGGTFGTPPPQNPVAMNYTPGNTGMA